MMPRTRPHEVHNTDGISDGAQENENPEGADQVKTRGASGVITHGACPKRPDVARIHGAAETCGGFDQQRANSPKLRRPMPVDAGIAARFECATRITRTLARASGAAGTKLKPGFSTVPVEQSPSEAKEVGEAASHRSVTLIGVSERAKRILRSPLARVEKFHSVACG